MNAHTATIKDITGEISWKRLVCLLVFFNVAWIFQNVLHFVYLILQTDRSIFSSFKHFEDHQFGSITGLIVINSVILLVYALLFIYGFISNLANFKRTELFQKIS